MTREPSAAPETPIPAELARHRPDAKPRFGVRISAGLVTYFNGEPILTFEQGEEIAAKIAEAHGEQGEVERVYVL